MKGALILALVTQSAMCHVTMKALSTDASVVAQYIYCPNYKFAQYALAAICKIALLTEQ